MSQEWGNDMIKSDSKPRGGHFESPEAIEDKLPSIHTNEINGLECPSCGHPTLMVMAGGYITCCLLDCPNPDYADAIQAIITTETTRARKQAASDIFTLAHEYAQNDDTMVGSEELRAYHYYNALHKIGGFSDR